MKLVTTLTGLSPEDYGAAAAIGNFDGVHKGHRKLILECLSQSKSLGCKSLVLTFEPHPMAVLQKKGGPKLLTTIRRKVEIMESLGVDIVLIVPFTPELSQLTPEQFVVEVLAKLIMPSTVFVGFNFAFGINGTGNPALLATLGQKEGFEVRVVPPVRLGKTLVSSSTVRKVLQGGDIKRAFELLGYWPSLEGEVVPGDQRGSKIGFPTANVFVPEEILVPGEGVYAAKAVVEGKYYPAMINIGRRPTFGSNLPKSIEAHLIGYEGNLYAKRIVVEFRARVRPEIQFDAVNTLVRQLQQDLETTRHLLGE